MAAYAALMLREMYFARFSMLRPKLHTILVQKGTAGIGRGQEKSQPLLDLLLGASQRRLSPA